MPSTDSKASQAPTDQPTARRRPGHIIMKYVVLTAAALWALGAGISLAKKDILSALANAALVAWAISTVI